MTMLKAIAGLTTVSALLVAGAIRVVAQDAANLRKADPPANGVWVDSLDLSKASVRRPRAGRGQPAPNAQPGQTPPALTFSLGGVVYPHAVPLMSDADLALDLKGKAVLF
ncbi:MAG: hypothetical protein ABSH28_07750, partial [Acidobacteriota bacterium]